MSWALHDEWIDLAESRHVAIFRNRDTEAEHHLIHAFNLSACPTCGDPKETAKPVDFHAKKAEILETLNAHHRQVLQYGELHPQVRRGSGPKK